MTWSDILAALKSGSWVSVLGTVVTAAVMFGLLDSAQASAVSNTAAAVATALSAVVALWHTLHAARLVARSRRAAGPVALGR